MKKIKRINLLITVFLIAACLGLTHCSSRSTPQTQPAVGTPAKQQTTGAENSRTQTGTLGENIEPAANDTETTPNELLEQALAACQDAQTAWEEGDTDSALDALDEAYNNIIKVEVSQESPLIQEKNNLRLMIAQRIQEIYTSRSSKVINNHQSIPLVENKYVLAEIKRFQTSERQSFLAAYKRSGRYRHMIVKELKKAGLPEELSWLPVVESWFKVRAYSRARALGLWQFISSTGYRFGLKKDRWVDERMDPVKATRAAVKYLDVLHSLFGDWTSALASYNCGEFQVQRVIRAQRINYLDNFWDLFVMLPGETARFVPRIIGTILIIQNPAKYGFELPDPDPPLRYEIVLINKAVKLSTLSQILGLQGDELAALNPELRHNATPDREYHIKVPDGYGRRTLTAIPSLSRWIPAAASYSIHRVRRG